jgi:hypothetical protein
MRGLFFLALSPLIPGAEMVVKLITPARANLIRTVATLGHSLGFYVIVLLEGG